MKTENLTKYMCDCCGKTEYTTKNETSLIQQFRLPMKYCSETGKDMGYTNQAVDLCSNCLRELALNLTKHYRLYCVAYGGVTMERWADDGTRTDN